MDTKKYVTNGIHLGRHKHMGKNKDKTHREKEENTERPAQLTIGKQKITQMIAFDYLTPTASITRVWYSKNTQRGLLSMTHSRQYRFSHIQPISMALVEIIKPLLGLTEHHCKNSKEPRSQKSQNSTKRKPQISNIRSLQKDQPCYGLGKKNHRNRRK